jgi:hypothetical protein
MVHWRASVLELLLNDKLYLKMQIHVSTDTERKFEPLEILTLTDEFAFPLGAKRLEVPECLNR